MTGANTWRACVFSCFKAFACVRTWTIKNGTGNRQFRWYSTRGFHIPVELCLAAVRGDKSKDQRFSEYNRHDAGIGGCKGSVIPTRGLLIHDAAMYEHLHMPALGSRRKPDRELDRARRGRFPCPGNGSWFSCTSDVG